LIALILLFIYFSRLHNDQSDNIGPNQLQNEGYDYDDDDIIPQFLFQNGESSRNNEERSVDANSDVESNNNENGSQLQSPRNDSEIETENESIDNEDNEEIQGEEEQEEQEEQGFRVSFWAWDEHFNKGSINLL